LQFYLPRDASATHIGTIFHDVATGRLAPQGDAEAVRPPTPAMRLRSATTPGTSADPVGNEVESRDSILLTYFVDTGLLRILRNRGKRIGNFLLSEAKHVVRK